MNRLSTEKRAQIIGMLVEGNSLRSTSRMADVSINTVTKLLIDVGEACREYQDKTFVNLSCKRLQVDEIWSFCYAKQKNVKTAKDAPIASGDIWTWTSICADTKLVPSWLVGKRDANHANVFIADLAGRLKDKVRITRDGLKSYVESIEHSFDADVDYALLFKIYGETVEGQKGYSPAECAGIKKNIITGKPDFDHVSTSFVELQNLTMRMSMRRFTRLTNGFSKKIENHEHAIALHFMYYNFVRIHKTLRVSPAMAANVETKLWSLEDIAKLTDSN